MMSVSVIIPAYNSAKFIEQTLQSVFKQTSPPLEIIVINDGSTDNTAEIVSRFSNVKLINQENQGVSFARNRGIRESKGDWVAFLDGDDLWLPEKLERAEILLKTRPDTEMISTAFCVGNGLIPWVKVIPRRLFNENLPFFNQLYRRSFIATSSVMVKKTVFEKVGGFDSKLSVAEDLDLWLRMALSGVKFLYINEYLLNYRSHITSITSNPLNFQNDIKSVFLKYRAHAGYKLFVKRMAIWYISTALTLYGQGRYISVAYSMLQLGINLAVSPFIYPSCFHKKDLKKSIAL